MCTCKGQLNKLVHQNMYVYGTVWQTESSPGDYRYVNFVGCPGVYYKTAVSVLLPCIQNNGHVSLLYFLSEALLLLVGSAIKFHTRHHISFSW